MEYREEWKDIHDLPGYAVSNQGRIKRLASRQIWNGRSFYTKPEAILFPTSNKSGYLVVNVFDKVHYMHRLVAVAFVGGKAEGLDVNHKDGNKWNNCAWNLEWCTRQHNIQHAFDTGLSPKGEANVRCKYPDEIVEAVKAKRLETGLSPSELRKQYFPGIPRTTISSFIHGYIRSK